MKINKRKEEITNHINSFIRDLLTEHGGMNNGYETIVEGFITKDSGSISKLYLPEFNMCKDAKQLGKYIKYYYQGEFVKELRKYANKLVKTHFGNFTKKDIPDYTIKFKSYHVEHGCFRTWSKIELDI